MYRNLIIILILACGLAALLFFKPWEVLREDPPRIYDRLPEADIIGQSDVLSLSRSLSMTMYYYRIPFRDFLSPNFILAQSKNYGLDIQKPVFFFANEKKDGIEDWGVLINVRDSSKITEGIIRLRQLTDISDTLLLGKKVYRFESNNVSMAYGDDWMFVYIGKHFYRRLKGVLFAKRNEIQPKWRYFINANDNNKSSLVAEVHSKKFDRLGIESTMISLTNDSSSLVLHTAITQFDSLLFQLKPVGPTLTQQEFSKHLINLHFDIERLRRSPSEPIYKALNNLGRKVGFPTGEFFEAWEGDLAFRQGGLQVGKEKYIVSELDENFNVTEVTKYRKTKIPGFTLYLSMNDKGRSFITHLLDKGILTQSEDKFRFLYSPPFNLKIKDSAVSVYSGTYMPKTKNDSINEILWMIQYTPVQIYIDSTKTKTVYGRIQIPLQKIVSDYLL